MADKKVIVEYGANTKPYVKGIDSAIDAQEDLEKQIKKTNDAAEDSPITSGVAKESFDDLNKSITQTSEGLIDSATGMSGLGAAFTSIATRIRTAAAGLSVFSKALIATGIGAAIAGIALLVAYWEDISIWIGLSEKNLEAYNEEQDRAIGLLETRVKIAELLGQEEEAQNLRLQIMQTEYLRAVENYKEAFSAGIITDDNRAAIEEARANMELAYAELYNYSKTLNEKSTDDETEYKRESWSEWDAYRANIEANYIAKAINSTDEYLAWKADQYRINIDEIADIEEEAINATTQAEIEAIKKRVEARKAAAAKDLENEAVIKDAKISTLNSVFDIGTALAVENQELQAALMIGQAIANGALAITNVQATTPPPVWPAAIGAVIASTAAQIATITAQLGGSGGGALASTPAIGLTREAVETGVPDTQIPQIQTVLVTSDLDRVQNQVRVTADRSSI